MKPFTFVTMRRHSLSLILIVLLLHTINATAQEKWNLVKCVDYARNNNIQVRQSDVQEKLARITYIQSKDDRWPTANLAIGGRLSSGRTIDPTTNQFTTTQVWNIGPSLQSNVTLFNWFSKKNTIEANKYTFQASEAQTEKIKDDISLNVANAYLQALLAYEQIQVAEVSVKKSIDQLSNTRKRVNAGALPELNAAELETQLAVDSSTLLNARNTYELNLLQLKALLNMDAAAPFDIATPDVETIPVEPLAELEPSLVYALALNNQPLQMVNKFKLMSLRSTTAASRGKLYPTISAFGSLSTNYSSAYQQFIGGVPTKVGLLEQFDNLFGQMVGINVNVPIFNGNAAKSNVQRSRLNETTQLLQMEQDSLTLKQNIYQAYQNAKTGLETYNSRKRSVELAEKSLMLGQKRYDIGLLPTLDLIILQNNLQTARINMLSSQFDYVFRMKVLEFYKGRGIKL